MATSKDAPERRAHAVVVGGSIAGLLVGQLCSRPLLEWSIRRRLGALPNVRTLGGCSATSLAASGDGGRVTGLRYRQDGGLALRGAAVKSPESRSPSPA